MSCQNCYWTASAAQIRCECPNGEGRVNPLGTYINLGMRTSPLYTSSYVPFISDQPCLDNFIVNRNGVLDCVGVLGVKEDC